MPFEFTGDVPELGSILGVFRPLEAAKLGENNTTPPTNTSSFGNRSSFQSSPSHWFSRMDHNILRSSLMHGGSTKELELHASTSPSAEISTITKQFTRLATSLTLRPQPLEELPPEPKAFLGIKKPSAFYNAMQGKIHWELVRRHWRSTSETELASGLSRLIASGTTKVDIRRTLCDGAFAAYVPSYDAESEFADWLWTMIWKFKHDFTSGWRIVGKDDASYFGMGKDVESSQTPMLDRDIFSRGGHFSAMRADFNRCCELAPSPLPETRNAGTTDTDAPFRFLNLPPELRTWIYKEVLSPGLVSLRTCAHHIPYGTSPNITPGLLVTCKQINEEAAGLVLENTFIVDLYASHTPTHRIMHRQHMPDHILTQITSLILVVDLGTIHADEFANVEANWRPLALLTSLQHLSIAGLPGALDTNDGSGWLRVIEEIVARTPSGCSIEVEAGNECVEQHIMGLMSRIKKKEGHLGRSSEMKRVKVATLEAALQEITEKNMQGSKSGNDFAKMRLAWPSGALHTGQEKLI